MGFFNMSAYTDRQLQIIDAAVELIAEGGIQGLTMKHLAGRIGISEPAIYRHFDNKVAILEAMHRVFADEKCWVFSEVVASEKPAVEKILSIVENHLFTFSQKPAMAAVIFSEDIFQNEKQITDMVARIMAQCSNTMLRIVTDGQSNGGIRPDIPPEHLVTIIMGGLRLIVKKWNFAGHAFDLLKEGRSFSRSLRKILEQGV